MFDLDGTLVDSAPDIMMVLNATLAAERLAPFDVDGVKAMVGGGSRRLIERALTARGETADSGRVDRLVDAFERIYADNPCSATRVYPGAVALLEALTARGIRIGLCTNKPGSATLPLLDALDLTRHFGAVVTGSDGFAKKPDAAMLAAALAKLNCTAVDGVMVGDSAADAGCARAAGCPVVLVSFGYAHEPVSALKADAVVDSLAEVLHVLPSLARSSLRA